VGQDQHRAAVAVLANPVQSTLDRLATDAAAGTIKVPVSRTYSLAEVPAAFADFAAGTVGKLSISVA